MRRRLGWFRTEISIPAVMRLALLGMALFTLLSGGCARKPAPLLFHAAAGQRSALDECQGIFQARHPETRVNLSYKGSGYLLSDLVRSREGDLFMPGEEFYFLQARERGLLGDYDPARDVPAFFVTVLITPRGNPAGIRRLEDLARPGVRVGLGNPRSCAIGVWQEKTLKKAGILEAVRANTCMSAKCIPELGNATQHRGIDATIVWSPTAALYLRDVDIIPLEHRYRGVVRLPVGVLRTSTVPEKALLLKDLLLSPEGRQVFARHAYAIEPGPVDAEGFCTGPGPSDRLMEHLVQAARVTQDPSLPVSEKTLGPLVGEVLRQRASK